MNKSHAKSRNDTMMVGATQSQHLSPEQDGSYGLVMYFLSAGILGSMTVYSNIARIQS